MQENMKEYLTEKEAKEKRLEVYTEKIQEKVLSRSSETIRQLVEERPVSYTHLPWEAPPYFWSTVFIKIRIRLSVARIRKGENPKERIFLMTFKLYCPKVIFTGTFFPNKKVIAKMQESICEITVAMAAPEIPI